MICGKHFFGPSSIKKVWPKHEFLAFLGSKPFEMSNSLSEKKIRIFFFTAQTTLGGHELGQK